MYSMNNYVTDLIRVNDTRDPFELCEKLKIKIVYENLGEISGVFRKVFGNEFIILNENLSDESRRVTCARELSHFLLHQNWGYENVVGELPKTEKEAIYFAELLLDL